MNLDDLKFVALITVFATTDLVWWRVADRAVRGWRGGIAWRVLVAAFALAMLGYLGLFVTGSFTEHVPDVRLAWSVTAYVWHITVGFGMLLVIAGVAGVRWIRRRRSAKPRAEASVDATVETSPLPAPVRLSRRQVLTAAGVAIVPPLITGGLAARGIAGLDRFRVRTMDLAVPNLPPDLDGLSIAHVTDLHIGRFLPPGVMERVAEATNALQADLVAFTGDLLDASCETYTPALDFLKRLDPRHGLALIEGNHDGMRGADRFEGVMMTNHVPLLLDDARTFRVPGRSTPVQMLGISWGELKWGWEMGRSGSDTRRKYRMNNDRTMAQSVAHVWGMREAGAFPILLAHHPHAFDPAAAVGVPLVLAGHTHGGQIHLTDDIGAGPLRFRYWRGVYERPGSKMFIGNGVGNWFPLRVNAPAEVVKVVLKRA